MEHYTKFIGEWTPVEIIPECKIENEWGFYARVAVKTKTGYILPAVYDEFSGQFMTPFDGEEIGGVVEWCYRAIQ
jgi:hypothetical protein